jgi:hypothetical protein
MSKIQPRKSAKFLTRLKSEETLMEINFGIASESPEDT